MEIRYRLESKLVVHHMVQVSPWFLTNKRILRQGSFNNEQTGGAVTLCAWMRGLGTLAILSEVVRGFPQIL